MESQNVEKIKYSSIREEELQRCREKLNDTLKLLFMESETVIPLMLKIRMLSRSINVDGESSLNISSGRTTIHALQKLRTKLTNDIEAIERFEAEQNMIASAVAISSADFLRVTVPIHSSPRAEPLFNYNYEFRPSTSRRPFLSMRSPSEVKPKIRTPLQVPSPVIESTPKAAPRETEPVLPISPAVPPTEPEDPQASDNIYETGTLCSTGGGVESEGEETEVESEEMESDDSEYVDEESYVGHLNHRVKSEETLKTQEPVHTTPIKTENKIKRQRNPTDHFDPDKIKRIKEESVYISSDKLVKEKGAWIRQEKETLKFLQNHYNSNEKRWKKVQGKGRYRDQEVIVNPDGVEYVLKYNPLCGKDFFLSAQDALAYCRDNCKPERPLPISTDNIQEGQDMPLDNSVGNTKEGNDFDSYSDSVYSAESDELHETSFAACSNNCSCPSKTNCRCYVSSQ